MERDQLLPEGRYRAKATEGALGESSNGNPQVAVCCELLDAEYAGREITWFGSFSKNKGQGKKTPLERTIETLRTFGWEGDDLSDLTGIDANEVNLVVEHEEYPEGSGDWQAKVKWVNRGGLALKAPMSPESAKAFAAKMRGEVIAASRGIARPKPATKPNGSGSVHPNAPGGRVPGEDDGDDPLPF